MDTDKMDRYEKRAMVLEGGHERRKAKSDDPLAFVAHPHEVEVLTLIAMFRKASKTYQGS